MKEEQPIACRRGILRGMSRPQTRDADVTRPHDDFVMAKTERKLAADALPARKRPSIPTTRIDEGYCFELARYLDELLGEARDEPAAAKDASS
jgi:hypothetical protein